VKVNLARLAQSIPSARRPSPLAGAEHVRGFGIYALPFSSGHVLALRVFPESDFGPYTSIWHRDPEGAWSIYVDGVALEQACPRYFGACADSRPARIAIEWRGPRKLRVLMDEPALDWDVSMGSSLLFAAMNLVAPLIPERLYRRPLMLGLFARAARRWFGMGDIDLLGTVPNGQLGILLPRRMLPVVASRAMLGGQDLGEPVRAREIPPSEPCVCPPARCSPWARGTSPLPREQDARISPRCEGRSLQRPPSSTPRVDTPQPSQAATLPHDALAPDAL